MASTFLSVFLFTCALTAGIQGSVPADDVADDVIRDHVSAADRGVLEDMKRMRAELMEQKLQLREQQAQLREQQAKSVEQQAKFEEQQAKFVEQQAKIEEQQVKSAEQQAKFKEQQAKMDDYEIKIAEQQKEIGDLRAQLTSQEATNTARDGRFKSLSTEVLNSRINLTDYVDRAVGGEFNSYVESTEPDKLDTTQHACVFDIIEMSCPDDGLVFIVTASFGQWASECDVECCEPDVADDCTEDMELYNDIAWNEVKLACNYNNNCVYQHGFHVMTSCAQQQQADYMSITYVCSNDDAVAPTQQQVAFTAYNTRRNYYGSNNRIEFDGVLTNVGGHFDNSSTFTCPVDGLYFFSFSVMGDYAYSDSAYVTLRHDGGVMVGAYADHYYNDPQSSNTAVMRCGAGEEVYLLCETGAYMHSSSNRYVTFSGFLISAN